jgi:hypothetical protein
MMTPGISFHAPHQTDFADFIAGANKNIFY